MDDMIKLNNKRQDHIFSLSILWRAVLILSNVLQNMLMYKSILKGADDVVFHSKESCFWTLSIV
jgi:hypothetical protein